GVPGRFRLPRPMLHSGDLDFSFSGLKTAVLNVVSAPDWDPVRMADLAAEFQRHFLRLAEHPQHRRQTQRLQADGKGGVHACASQKHAASTRMSYSPGSGR
ncbi:MAG TPA: hypothetical protein PKI32_09605, partial [Opitutales bacterium]|nr:hypothetical protein [Opitutales bacterium]